MSLVFSTSAKSIMLRVYISLAICRSVDSNVATITIPKNGSNRPHQKPSQKPRPFFWLMYVAKATETARDNMVIKTIKKTNLTMIHQFKQGFNHHATG